ncbi:uncharacterized protein LOC120267295 [Dioscorea cayenensis subsp. rotundata]|uniref:Uncharacterized protein LOC120267295 n=1 Tax=Dioscorea cayennensis subsp. rotundata TaxID=55577 RepID=A0AB40BTX1_DIOCR|nr:uncharacterized protein LOC120267295 [Dioscorea cayenensis subsp. rotundata]
MEEDHNQDDEFSDEEEDDEMSGEELPDDSPDDDMTLIQYQTEARREALVQKETRANADRLARFCRKVSKHWDWAAILSDGFSGGIIVLWHKSVGVVTPVSVSKRALHIIITNNSSKTFLISVIYNSSRFRKQCFLWNELSKLSALHIPWLILGGFNSILHRFEHKGGTFAYYDRKARFFRNFIEFNNLIDLNYSGPHFTWYNNQLGLARCWARLDRCLFNLDWANSFNFNSLKHLARSFSDHSPLFLSSAPFSYHTTRIFRFDINWLDFIGCHDAIHDAWNCHPHGNPLQAFSHLLSRACYNLSNWHRSGINSLEADLASSEITISNLEKSDFNSISQSFLMDQYANLASLQRQCSIKWAQRARMLWIKDGDRNTSFFHATTRIRAHSNFISKVVDSNGVCCQDHTSIERAFLNFYMDLWSAPSVESDNLLNLLPTNLPRLNDSVASSIVREVTKEEVFQTLLDLPTGKSPGPDGFCTEFYHSFWPIIGDHLFLAVRCFFERAIIPSSWGKTFITLIPKKDHPHSVSDFRPISLCNVNFKIISKLLANRMQLVLPSLIGREQAGFVTNRCSFDNIIAVQEIVHTLETDTKNPPRMLIKLDIEKTYDTVNWNAILAVFDHMNFPPLWISWISTCLRSCSFSLLINGNSSPWFPSSRGVRQGDPISSYLFILVSQILTAFLNQGLKAARNINHCLEVYRHITGQRPNLLKSQIFFPTWCNKHVSSRICSILNLTQASFPFKYLGILISHKRLAASSFNPMVVKIRHLCSRWSNYNLSQAAKTTLINSTLFSIPTYTLSVYPIPDSIISEITRIVRKFFWCRNSNGKGIHNLNWKIVNEDKAEGGIGIRNLSLAKYSLMAKHFFNYLNNGDAIWVDILRSKYGDFNFWKSKAPTKCSWFFRYLTRIAGRLKPNCRINSVNPARTSFLWDPWCFDIPIALKPTFINMDVDVDLLTVSDVILGDRWNETHLHHVFGHYFDAQALSSSSINPNTCNHWVWNPNTKHHKIAATVYNHLNHNLNQSEFWYGWQLLWKLNISPRAKHFLWMLFHGRLSTSNFLSQLRLGPDNPCALCGLFPEMIDHLFCHCNIAKQVWNYLSMKINTHIHFPIGFSVGLWLTERHFTNHCKSVIAASAWLIWKSRCDVIFRDAHLNIPVIVCRALSHVQEHIAGRRCLAGQKLIMHNFSCADELFLFSHSSSIPGSSVSSAGFFLSNSNYVVNFAGCCSIVKSDSVLDEIYAFAVALQSVMDNHLTIKHIFVNTYETLNILSHQIAHIRSLLDDLDSPTIHCISKSWMLPAVNLATHGVNSSDINLFLFGRDLPRWIMLSFSNSGFQF